MKNTFKLGKTAAALLGVLALTVGGTSALAADNIVTGQTGSTNTTVDIKEPDTDPIDPEVPGNPDPINPNQKSLTLEHVPTNYNFETNLSNKTYTISSGTVTEDTIDVFNDYSKRKWVVKAQVENDELTKGADKYPVTEFSINGNTLATGTETVVMQNKDLTVAGNTGKITDQVTSVGVKFTDSGDTLKVGDTLTGKINYQLYLVSGAD